MAAFCAYRDDVFVQKESYHCLSLAQKRQEYRKAQQKEEVHAHTIQPPVTSKKTKQTKKTVSNVSP